jgi:hypothetical protein
MQQQAKRIIILENLLSSRISKCRKIRVVLPIKPKKKIEMEPKIKVIAIVVKIPEVTSYKGPLTINQVVHLITK